MTGMVVGASAADASVPHATKAHTAAATSVSVAAVEYKFKLSKTSISKPGTVTFKVTNKGKEPHDFKIDNKQTALLEPGKSATLTVKFAKKGGYAYLCTVPGHAQLGMKGTFTVK
jgi:nitrite reductase (NO-forming)